MYILDDSVGALIFEKYSGIGGNFIIDNKNYPIALRKSEIEKRVLELAEKIDGEILCTNPSMSLYLKNLKNAVTGLEEFEKDFFIKRGLVLSNKIFANKYSGVDVQILANTVVDNFISEYTLKNLLSSYIGEEKTVYVMEPCIHYYRDLMEKNFRDVEFHFLFDYLKTELKNNKKSKYYVTGKRIGFYMGAEELLGGRYSVRTLKW